MTATRFSRKTILYTALLPAAFIFIICISRLLFEQEQKVLHQQLERTLQLDFDNGLKEQLSLALQMSKSPAIIAYFENPTDESLAGIAFKEVATYQNSFLSGITFMINDIDLKYYSNNEELYVLDRSASTSKWYSDAMNYSGEYIFNVSFDIGLKKTFMWVNIIVRSQNGKVLGLIGTGIPLTNFVDTMYKDLPQGFDMYLFNADKEITSARDVSLMENKVPISNVVPFLSGLEDEIISGRMAKISTFGKYCSFARIDSLNWNIVILKKFDAASFLSNARIPFLAVLVILFVNILAYIYRKRTQKSNSTVGQSLLFEMEKLVNSTKENTQTSQDQNAAVKEIVSTMEDSNSMTETISRRIQEVSAVASKTSADVISGVDILMQNVDKLHEISQANSKTIECIKSLGEKINSIWEIVSLINSVADQAKIIAFNAELEASSAGEAGKNFHIVATEIRRLANGIIDGTVEIRERISEIQQSSDSLILISESGTEKVDEGCQKAKELEEMFSSLKTSAEVTADSSKEITDIVGQQTESSNQILIALKQIAFGVEAFSNATDRISESAEQVRMIAEKLNGDAR